MAAKKKTAVRLRVPYHKQETQFTCGPAVLRMILHHHGDYMSERYLRKYTKTTEDGTDGDRMIKALRKLGYYCFVTRNAQPKDIKYFINHGMPVVIHWEEPENDEGHYSVIIGYNIDDEFYLHDPDAPRRKVLPKRMLLPRWTDGSANRANRWMLVASKERIQPESTGKTYTPLTKN